MNAEMMDNRFSTALTGRSVRARLWAGGLFPVLMFLAFALWLWQALGDVQDQLEHQVAQQLEQTLLIKTMQTQVVQVQQFLSDVSATRGQDGLDDGFKLAGENRQSFLASLGRLADQASAQGDADKQRELAALRVAFESYYQSGQTMAHAYVQGGPAAGNPLMGDFDKISASLQVRLEPFVARESERLVQGVLDAAQQASLVRLAAAVVAALAAGLALVSAWWLTRSITQPLQQACQALQSLATGQLDKPLQTVLRDEFGQLLKQLEWMRQRWVESITQIRMSVEAVSTATREISAGNAELSQRTCEQAAVAEQTHAALQDLSRVVQHNADHALSAQRLSQQASEAAERGGAVVGQVVTTMQDIAKSSHEIGDIIGVIDGIAFQTNILALNAAVEAARAGEQGRGFAVVASEVRSLASRSAEAARQIKTLIQRSVERVEAGTSMVDDAGHSMRDLVKQVQQVSWLLADLANQVQHQSRDISQINTAMGQVDASTQQNAALVEQSSAAALSLDEQAHSLTRAVAFFKTV